VTEYKILLGDCRETLKTLPEKCVDTVVTSPPYFGLRDYNNPNQIGQEQQPEDFVNELVNVFREVRRVLKDEGTVWLNLGDSYAGSGKNRNGDGSINEKGIDGKQGTSLGTVQGNLKPLKAHEIGLKPKDLIGIPWMVAFALRADGWYLRQDIIWSKPNPMPESVKDRCTKSHEYIFLLSKSKKYYYDHEAIKEEATGERWGGNTPINMENTKDTDNVFSGLTRPRKMIYDKRNKRSVWTVTPKAFKGAHFATYPPELIEPCILAGCPVGGTVLDPFGGSGTTAGVAYLHDRNSILCELNPEYAELVERRIEGIIEGKRTLGAVLPI
jgi:DNA modification methylase